MPADEGTFVQKSESNKFRTDFEQLSNIIRTLIEQKLGILDARKGRRRSLRHGVLVITYFCHPVCRFCHICPVVR